MEKQKNEIAVMAFDVSQKLPDLSTAEPTAIDLVSDYWSPEVSGESKRLIFLKIENRLVADQQTGELIELECAYFAEKAKDDWHSISNGSKRLVGALTGCNVAEGTALLVTFLGKKKNKTNGFSSDNWSVKPLIKS